MRPANYGASVRQRLKNLAAKEHRDVQHVFTAYATERLLYRLSESRYRGRFQECATSNCMNSPPNQC